MISIWNTLITVFLAATPASAFHVVLDPGHGGHDHGAVRGSLRESTIVMQIALRLRELLKEEPGLTVSMTRENDGTTLPLPQRIAKVKATNADLLVSLHANSAPDDKVHGLELFFENSLPPDEEALYLANLENQATDLVVVDAGEAGRKGDIAAIVEDLKRQHRLHASLDFARIFRDGWIRQIGGKRPSIKQAPFQMVSRCSVPAVLVELGFLTNPTEAAKLTQDSYRDQLARQLRDSIREYRRARGPINETPIVLR